MRIGKEKILKFCTAGNIFAVFYIILVFVILLVPSFGVKTKKNLYVDNRPAAPFPEISCSNFRNFAPQFEKWLSDRFQTRKQYIRIWNRILFYLFRESPHEQIVLGKDGFVFLAGHYAGKENENSLFRSLLDLDPETIRVTVRGLLNLQPTFRRVKPKLLFVAVPSKHTLNYDKIPEKIRRNFPDNPAGIPVFTKITERLKEADPAYAEEYFLDLYPDALSANRKMQLIPPKSFHWVPGPYTHLAAHWIARKMHVIREPFVLNRENYCLCDVVSDLKHFFGFDLSDRAWILSGKSNPVKKRPIPDRFLPENCPEVIPEMGFYAQNPSTKGGRLLAIGDSFTPAACQDLARYFSEVIVMDFAAMRRYSSQQAGYFLKGVIKKYQPEYVISVSYAGYLFADAVMEAVNDPSLPFSK